MYSRVGRCHLGGQPVPKRRTLLSDIQDFVNRIPGPPPIPRGQRRIMSLAFSEVEEELIKKIAYSPDTRFMYDGHVQNVVRHAVCAFLEPLWEYLDSGTRERTVAEKLREQLRNHEILTTREAIDELVTTKARSLNLLMDCGETQEALAVYDTFLNYIHSLGNPWSRIVRHFVDSHSEMEAFRDKIIKADEGLTLASIENQLR